MYFKWVCLKRTSVQEKNVQFFWLVDLRVITGACFSFLVHVYILQQSVWWVSWKLAGNLLISCSKPLLVPLLWKKWRDWSSCYYLARSLPTNLLQTHKPQVKKKDFLWLRGSKWRWCVLLVTSFHGRFVFDRMWKLKIQYYDDNVYKNLQIYLHIFVWIPGT